MVIGNPRNARPPYPLPGRGGIRSLSKSRLPHPQAGRGGTDYTGSSSRPPAPPAWASGESAAVGGKCSGWQVQWLASTVAGKCGGWQVRWVEGAVAGMCGGWKLQRVEGAVCGRYGGRQARYMMNYERYTQCEFKHKFSTLFKGL